MKQVGVQRHDDPGPDLQHEFIATEETCLRDSSLYWEEQVKVDLHCDVLLGVIECCLPNDKSEWCVHMHIVAKSNNRHTIYT